MARAPLTAIKTSVQSILDTANTTTGSPIDLSLDLVTRVQQVYQVNPERIRLAQPSKLPYITMFYDSKNVELQDIAGNMLMGRRRADIDLTIVGFVWIDNMNTANFQYKDLADNECETLMENVEQVLRSDPTLGGNALWSKTVAVTYHNFPVSEDAHMRAGVMTHRITVMY